MSVSRSVSIVKVLFILLGTAAFVSSLTTHAHTYTRGIYEHNPVCSMFPRPKNNT